MTNTTNYNLKKPATSDYYNVQDQNDNMDTIDAALKPTADPAQAPSGNVGKLAQWVSWLTNRIKAITGGTNWYDAPAISLAQANNLISSHMGNVSNPHATTKSQVGLGNVDNTSDANKPVSTAQQTALNAKAPIASPTFTGTAKATANTDYTTLQLRNISLYADGATVPTLGNGEIAFTYK